MDVQRGGASAGFVRTTTQDENAHAMMHRSGKDGALRVGGGSASANRAPGSTVTKGLGGKTFGATTGTGATQATQATRSALGNITNKGLSARGGASAVAVAPTPTRSVKGQRAKAKAPAPALEAPAPALASSVDDDAGLERVRATIAPEELANIRARAEMYADESDDIEYFGKTHEEQAKEERARERAAVEERVREFLANAAAAASYDANFGTTTSMDDKNESLRASIKNLSLKASFTSDGGGGGGFNADGEDDVMDDLCNFMSPTKIPGMLDDDDDVDDVLFGGRPGVDDLAYLDEELDAMLAD